MISYPHVPPIGPIQPFGLLVVIGVAFGIWCANRYVKYVPLEQKVMNSLFYWCLGTGFVFAHLIDLFFYQGDWTATPLKIGGMYNVELPFFVKPIAIWAGISSYGGFLGGLVGGMIALRGQKAKLEYGDASVLAILSGWMFGRAACSIVHDHLGGATDFFLGFYFEPGNAWNKPPGTFHDLGLYEFMYVVPLFFLMLAFVKYIKRPGFLTGAVMIIYSIPRFFLEFLRKESSDPRYFALTPAQYFSIAMTVTGIIIMVYIFKFGSSHPRIVPEPSQESS